MIFFSHFPLVHQLNRLINELVLYYKLKAQLAEINCTFLTSSFNWTPLPILMWLNLMRCKINKLCSGKINSIIYFLVIYTSLCGFFYSLYTSSLVFLQSLHFLMCIFTFFTLPHLFLHHLHFFVCVFHIIYTSSPVSCGFAGLLMICSSPPPVQCFARLLREKKSKPVKIK